MLGLIAIHAAHVQTSERPLTSSHVVHADHSPHLVIPVKDTLPSGSLFARAVDPTDGDGLRNEVDQRFM